MNDDLIECCFCGATIEFWHSHNPDPVATGETDRCCGTCNGNKVLPARFEELLSAQT